MRQGKIRITIWSIQVLADCICGRQVSQKEVSAPKTTM